MVNMVVIIDKSQHHQNNRKENNMTFSPNRTGHILKFWQYLKFGIDDKLRNNLLTLVVRRWIIVLLIILSKMDTFPKHIFFL